MNRDVLKASGKNRAGACSGGPAVSVAKRRRLAALDETLSAVPPKTERAVEPAPAQSASVSRTRINALGQATAASSEFPYNMLEDAVLDGSLSAALASAKAAALAAETFAASSGSTLIATCSKGLNGIAKALPSPSTTQTAAAATAVAIGGDSIAVEVFAQLATTNGRSSSRDLRSKLAQTLQARAVTLNNPTGPFEVNKLFPRRGTNYSAKLHAVPQQKSTDPQPKLNLQRIPCYEVMLRVHELWLQYTRNAATTPPAAGRTGGASNSINVEGPARALDLHGAILNVVRHPNPQLVGASGVVLKYNRRSVHLVTPSDYIRVVPLKGCIAQYTVNGCTMQLAG
ncbi:hypothetical protein VaNZ11_013555 [Volvox africanus]|uniref:Uncharacterized protein n=1 Tax=Volvox africanus TaxID=51714 RepID=A0ABQ5SGG0_9CHLO|nr:hypothetical protein VaNZ11_013555 [Volvox africanus]